MASETNRCQFDRHGNTVWRRFTDSGDKWQTSEGESVEHQQQAKMACRARIFSYHMQWFILWWISVILERQTITVLVIFVLVLSHLNEVWLFDREATLLPLSWLKPCRQLDHCLFCTKCTALHWASWLACQHGVFGPWENPHFVTSMGKTISSPGSSDSLYIKGESHSVEPTYNHPQAKKEKPCDYSWWGVKSDWALKQS